MESRIEKKDQFFTVTLSGRLTFVDHGAFKAVVEDVIDGRSKQCVLDLSLLEFIDSAGLGMLLIMKNEFEKAGSTLAIKSPKGQVEKMLQVSHFDRMFTIEE